MTSRWKWLLGISAFLLSPFLLVLIMHFKAKHDLAVFKKQLIAQGEKLTIAELIPPLVESESNGAKDLLESARGLSAASFMGTPAMILMAPGKARVMWAQEEIFDTSEKRQTNIWPKLREDMSQGEDDLEQLRRAIAKPKISFRPGYEQGFMMLLPHLAEVKRASQWLAASTIFHLHENQTNEAAESLKAAIRLPAVYAEEPMMISQLVRIATVQIAFSATWEALQFAKWDEATLQEFQDAWSELDFKKDMETTMAMERAMGIPIYEMARNSTNGVTGWWGGGGTTPTLKDEFEEITTEFFNDPKAAFQLLLRRPNDRLWQLWWSYEDEKFMLNFWQHTIEAQRVIQKQRSYYPSIEKLKAGDLEEIPSRFQLATFLKGSTRKFFLRCAIAETEREIAVAACALERHRIRRGGYPEKLENLVPDFIHQVPHDPVVGFPLKYRRNADGTYLLYSVGENGKDDGGDPTFERSDSNRVSLQFQKGRDWVWPQRATEAEIKKWEEEQSKKLR